MVDAVLDLAIIGSGPAAMTAAIYAARAELSVAIFEKAKVGGALTEIDQIGNFPGFNGSGNELAENLKKQVLNLGVKINYGACEGIMLDDSGDKILTIDGESVRAHAVLVATGSEPKTLDLDTPTPISYCAMCDAPLYKGKSIAVIGGGNSAIQETIYLAGIAKNVTVYTHGHFKADQIMVDEITALGNVEVRDNLSEAELDNYDGIFVFIGKRPATKFLPAELLDEKGYIITENYATKMPGVFAAGDVRANSVKQAVTAAADGAAAALEIVNFLKK